MSVENKLIVRRFFEGIGNGNLLVGEGILSDRLVYHCFGTGEDEYPDDLNRRFAAYSETFAELSARVEDQISEGDQVATRITWCGTFPEETQGGATTLMQVKWAEATIFRLDGGQIVEAWGNAGLAEGIIGLTGSSQPGLEVGSPEERQMEESHFPAAETLRGHVTSQQEQLEAKDRQISELHLLLQQAQTALAIPSQSPKRVSWWRWLLGWER